MKIPDILDTLDIILDTLERERERERLLTLYL
jgi:hypothetical protein